MYNQNSPDGQRMPVYANGNSGNILIKFNNSGTQMIDDAIDRLIIKLYLYKQNENKNSLLLTGCGSSNGSTTIAINLSIMLAAKGWSTLLIDLDFRKGNKYKHENRKSAKGLCDYLMHDAKPSDIIYRTNHEKMFFVPSGETDEGTIKLLCSERVKEFISNAAEQFDFIIFDCPSITVVPDAAVLCPEIDGVALVLALNQTTKKQLADAKIEMDKIGEKYYGLIINSVDEKQYRKFYPQYNYFDSQRLKKTHKKWLVKDEKRKADNNGQ